MPYTLIKNKEKEMFFGNVKIGEPFKWREQLFLKLGEATLSSGIEFNAFNFHNKEHVFFDKDDPVYEIDLEIKEV